MRRRRRRMRPVVDSERRYGRGAKVLAVEVAHAAQIALALFSHIGDEEQGQAVTIPTCGRLRPRPRERRVRSRCR